MIFALVGIPAIAAVVVFFVPNNSWQRSLIPLVAFSNLVLIAYAWYSPTRITPEQWFGFDVAGIWVATCMAIVFAALSLHLVGYLMRQTHSPLTDKKGRFVFFNAPQTRFISCLFALIAGLNLAAISQHYGMLWVATEWSALASAPLIYFHRSKTSLEATWKFIMICSVGIAFALLGNFCLSMALSHHESHELLVSTLFKESSTLDPIWIKAGFIFLLVGFGTKMGLAPMHTWVPDAYSEAPSPVSALFSGAAVNVAFLGIWRAYQAACAAGLADFARDLLTFTGLFTLTLAALLLFIQKDYKRMLAYSSIENMGLIALSLGLGTAGATASFFHIGMHSLSKGALFMISGNILGQFRSKISEDVVGLPRFLPKTAILWIAGLLAISGIPPFGLFFSKYSIIQNLFANNIVIGLFTVLLLAIAFYGLARNGLKMVTEYQSDGNTSIPSEPIWMWLPAALLLVATLLIAFLPLTDLLSTLALEPARELVP